jgi:uncharacterized protein
VIVCDTGPLVAVLNANDRDHQRCTDFLEQHPGPLLVPSPIVAEVCYMAEARVGPDAEAAFLRSLASGELQFAELTRPDLSSMAELVERYADLPLGAGCFGGGVGRAAGPTRDRHAGSPRRMGGGTRLLNIAR